jgi:dipeptidyl aminopeptidase/acylaminoacyl peptidase
MRKIILFSVVVTVFLSTGSLQAQQALTTETMLKIPRIGSPKISPDAARIAYTRTDVSIENNNSRTHIKIVDRDGNLLHTIQRNDASVSSPAWYDAQKLWYLSADEGKMHIWQFSTDGSTKKITSGDVSVKMFGISPNGKKIWMVQDVAIAPVGRDWYEGLPMATSAKILDGLMYRHWDSWHDGTYQHIFVGDITDSGIENLKNIMEGQPYDSPLKPFGSGGQIAFHTNDRFIAYTCKKETGTQSAVSTNSGIYMYDIGSDAEVLLTEENKGYDTYPSFSPDGTWLMWLSMETPGYEADKNRLMIRSVETGQTIELTAQFENGADAAKWDAAPGINRIIMLAGEEATYNLYAIEWTDATDVKITPITRETANYQDFSLAHADGRTYIAATKMSMSAPSELYLVTWPGGLAKRITFETDEVLKEVKMGQVEKRWVNTTDGKRMLTWVIYPPDFDPRKKYPALLYCQGGPQSAVSQFFSYRWNFQLMAANDYIIVAPNRRGLPTFGQEWNRQISGDYGGQAMADLLSAIDAVKTEPFVDEDRLGAVGASFGGYSVYWLAGNHDKRFKTFISHCGLFNLESMYGSTEEMFFVNFEMEGPYWQRPEPKSYHEFSPHKYVDNWDTPMLVIHNEKDFRVPITQGMEAFTAAQIKGVPSRFLYFPDEGHWVLKPQNSVLWNRVFFDWLDTWLK